MSVIIEVINKLEHLYPEAKHLKVIQDAKVILNQPESSVTVDAVKTDAFIAAKSKLVKPPSNKVKMYNTAKLSGYEFTADRPQFLTTNEFPFVLDGVEFPAATFVSTVDSKRHINVTVAQGAIQNSNVLETSSLMNRLVNVKGVATAFETGEKGFPYKWLDILRRMHEKNKRGVSLENKLLNRLGIDFVVSENLRFEFVTATVDYFGFEFRFVSDKSPELELAEQQEQSENNTKETRSETDKPNYQKSM